MVEALLKGAVAGTLASLVQAALGKTEGILMLPDGESADRAPRLMARLAAMRGATLSPRERWALEPSSTSDTARGGESSTHSAANAYRRIPPSAVSCWEAASTPLPRWGGAVWRDTERHPEVRTRQTDFVVASVTLSFGLATAFLYEALRADE
jgi:hypothetical protein